MNQDEESLRGFIREHLNRLNTEYYGGQDRLSQACHYALSGEGKRVRGILTLLCAASLGGRKEDAIVPALAVEMIHTYSLVHDDLPAFDDDDLRRGRPTVHVRFDVPTAILAGDALLTDAWRVLSEYAPRGVDVCSARRIALVREFALAGGSQGMALGQMMDMHWTGRDDYSGKDLEFIHSRKTGALIAAACVAGGVVAGAGPDSLENLRAFGSYLGLAFQVADDLLDDQDHTGKTRGKDREAGKLTYLKVMSRKEALDLVKKLTTQAVEILNRLPSGGACLQAFAESLLNRNR